MWTNSPESSESQWKSELTVKGHFNEVTDLCWDPETKTCLVSCSLDQTTRMLSRTQDGNFYEISRPQVHGYDMNTVTCLPNQKGGNVVFKILSGGDEKVIRLFDAPYSFVKTYNCLNAEVNMGQVKQMRLRNDISNQKVEELLGTKDEAAKK